VNHQIIPAHMDSCGPNSLRFWLTAAALAHVDGRLIVASVLPRRLDRPPCDISGHDRRFLHQDISATQTVLGCRPRRRPDRAHFLLGFGQRWCGSSVPWSSKISRCWSVSDAIGIGAREEPSDVEPGLANLNDAVDGRRGRPSGGQGIQYRGVPPATVGTAPVSTTDQSGRATGCAARTGFVWLLLAESPSNDRHPSERGKRHKANH